MWRLNPCRSATKQKALGPTTKFDSDITFHHCFTTFSTDAFWGMHISQGIASFSIALQAMATIPTPLFCSSPDPCSCVGGGIEEIFTEFCTGQEPLGNITNSSAKALRANITAAKTKYQSLFAFLDKDGTTVMVSLGVVLITGVLFITARMSIRVTIAEKRRREAEAQHAKIKKEL